MSDTTKAVLDAAIAAHFADENDGGLTTGWVLVTKGKNLEQLDDNRTVYHVELSDRLGTDEMIGLVRIGTIHSELDWVKDA